METINIVCACDKHFLPFTACMMCSVFENNQSHDIRVFLFYSGLSKLELRRLTKFTQKYQQTIFPIKINKKDTEGLVKWISIAVSFRLLMPTKLPTDVDKVLYLDSDLIVRRDLLELWETDLGKFHLAAVEDPGVIDKLRLGMAETSRYFNSGVMLVNLKLWRDSNLYSKVLSFSRINPNLAWADQDALNAVLDGEWMRLSQNWNMIYLHASKNINDGVVQQNFDPAIVHFAGPRTYKPWYLKSNVPFQSEYIYYQTKTPWKKTKTLHNRALTVYLLKSKIYGFLKEKSKNKSINSLKKFIFQIGKSINKLTSKKIIDYSNKRIDA